MNLDFYSTLIIKLIKRNKLQLLKQIMLGITITAILIFIYNFGVLWGNVVVFSYMILIQFICMMNNDAFLSFKDFKLFTINENNLDFKIPYIIQKIILDMYVCNLIIILSISSYLFIYFGSEQAIFFSSLILAGHIIMPSHNYFAYKIGDRGIIMITIVLMLMILGVVFGALNEVFVIQWLFTSESISNSLVIVLIALCYSYLIDVISKRYVGQLTTTHHTRQYLLWLKQINPFIYKDYLLFYKSILFNIIQVLILYSIISINTDKNLVPFVVAFVFAGSSIFTMKQKKEYRILGEDILFDELILEKDTILLRRSKLYTILTGSIIKVFLSYIFLLINGIINFNVLGLIFILMVLSAKVEYIIVYRNKLSSTIMFKTLIYSAILLIGITAFFGTYLCLTWLYLWVIAFIFLILINEIIRKRIKTTTMT